MKGSEKQIKWATEIKESFSSDFEKLITGAPQFAEKLKIIQNCEFSEFWIDVREISLSYFAEKLIVKGFFSKSLSDKKWEFKNNKIIGNNQ